MTGINSLLLQLKAQMSLFTPSIKEVEDAFVGYFRGLFGTPKHVVTPMLENCH